MKKFLHVGCGPKRKAQTTPGFGTPDWEEVRLDIDAGVAPDIVGSLTDLSMIEDGAMDAVFSSHNIEHVYPVEVATVLQEFYRVLAPDGFAVITCPDLKAVARHIVEDRLTDTLYMSGMGPIRPLDILFGHQRSVGEGNAYMAHKGGFTLKSLHEALTQAGFKTVGGVERPQRFDLWVVACRAKLDQPAFAEIAVQHIPGLAAHLNRAA